MTSSSKCYHVGMFHFVKFSYWSKFHVNIIPGSRVRTIVLYKELTRNLEIEIYGDCVNIWSPIYGDCVYYVKYMEPNIWRLEEIRDAKFGINVSNEMLLNLAKCQC